MQRNYITAITGNFQLKDGNTDITVIVVMVVMAGV
jgi:hypothetical protein